MTRADAATEPLADLMAKRAALLAELGAITTELKRRGLGRTDQVVGELGERLALEVYGGVLEPSSAPDIDLVDAAGRRIQVKARELPAGDQRMFQFSSTNFDIAVCIRFDRETFHLDWAREITVDEFIEIHAAHRAGPRLSGARASRAGIDVTERFRAAWRAVEVAELRT
jgi:hypothetical protein